MQAMSRRPLPFIIAFVLVLTLTVAACAPDPSQGVLSPDLGPRLVAQAAEEEFVVEPTPEPLGISDLSDEEITAGLPEDFAVALAAANPADGETIALANGCVGCHSLDPNQQMTGPTWFDAGDTAVGRVPGESPALYLYHSIVQPNAHIVEGYPQNIMPQNFSDLLSQDDLAAMVSYLLAQHE